MDEKVIIIVGDRQHGDFAAATGWLRSRAACKYCDDVAAATLDLRSPSMRFDPAAILLIQTRPGQFVARDVELLHAAAPLARLVALVGPWCEGQQRSGRHWRGVVCVPWRAWPYRLARELGLDDLPAGNKALPRTATEPERIER